MSKSPKYSRVSSSAERRRQQERARQQREREREERRKQREKEALQKARQRADKRLEQVARRQKALGADTAADPAESKAIRSSLDTAGKSIRQATAPGAVSAALRQLDEIDQRISRAEAAAQQSRQLEAAQRLEHLGRRLTEMEPAARQRFDPAGAAETDRLIGELSSLAKRGDTTAFPARADVATAAVDKHVRTVGEGVARHEEQGRELALRHADLAGRVADLESDAAAADVTLGDLRTARETLDYIADTIDADDLEGAANLTGRLGDRLGRLERDLDQAIDRIIARREMLGAIVAALPGLGFTVNPSSKTETADGTIGIQAFRSSGASLAVVVQDNGADEHRVSYVAEAFPGQSPGVREMSPGACDTVVDLAEALGASIGTAGFAVGEVTWDDGPGDLPPSGSAARRPGTQPTPQIPRTRQRRIGEQ